ncbi:hypothetical protein EDB19DRAFT_1637356 [Suillus lakei]|nr:hypothetical protein EDB19DRAFT_1637356 [Suillus lakei]
MLNIDSTSSELSAIQHQFGSDIFQLAPSPKLASEPPWILLNAMERQAVRIDIFDSLDLSGVFRQIQYRVASDSDWNDLVFGRYFPAKGASTVKGLQQFPSASYYRQWLALMEGLDEEKAGSIRTLQQTWFGKLYWVPYPSSDRMWFTKRGGREWTMLPPGESRNCPRLAINPRFNGKNVAVVVGEQQADVRGPDSSAITY